jgi:predicted NAD/FAD-binding protein
MEPIGRRSVLAGLGVGALGLAAGVVPGTVPAMASAAVPRQRVAVIGAGVAGVATAWLLDGEHDVTLLEAGSELGGHARGVEVRVGDKTIAVDGGAQYFGPGTHPIYMQLVDKVLRVPTVRISMDYTVSKYGERKPIMVSPNPPKRLLSTLQLAYLPALQAMATLVLSGLALELSRDWRPTLQEFVSHLPIPQRVKNDFVYPFYASMTGCTITDVKKVSARAAQAFVIRPLGDNPLAPFDYYNARDGLRAVISAMSDRLSTATVHLNAKVTRLAREGGTFRVETSDGSVFPADQVVLAAPPHAAGPLAAHRRTSLAWVRCRRLPQNRDHAFGAAGRTVASVAPCLRPGAGHDTGAKWCGL